MDISLMSGETIVLKSGKSQNRLKGALSPYLLQHADNPVHWWPWCSEALNLAKEKGKPILLSIGYSACHWCHVMAHESFEDPDTAVFMNEHFVNIKVDREERPDLDALYQRALHHTGGQGGWPLTVFLTANARPFFGGTYFPNQSRHGLPSFMSVLQRIHHVFTQDQNMIQTTSRAIWQALNQDTEYKYTERSVLKDVLATEDRLLALHDPVHGGLRGAPKFPQIPMLKALWGRYWTSGERPFKASVILTLEKICRGGIYDHLGGGFHRYSTDQEWLAPHFEKMLYDNAQIIEMLAHVWAQDPRPIFATSCKETIAWLLREMTDQKGAFFSSIDADSEGREGSYYVWGSDEIKQLLGEGYEIFSDRYDVTKDGNWEQVNILNRLNEAQDPSPNEKLQSERAKARLIKARDARPAPLVDDKILTDWNGMMISALVVSGRIFGEKLWIDAATRAFDAVLSVEKQAGKKLLHASRGGVLGTESFIDDYAQMIRAALLMYEATAKTTYLNHAVRWLEQAYDLFKIPGGGFYLTSVCATDSPMRPAATLDDAIPAAATTMLSNLARLAVLGDDPEISSKGDTLLDYLSNQFLSNPFGWASLGPSARAWLNRPSVHIQTASREPNQNELMLAAIACGCPDLVILRGSPPPEIIEGEQPMTAATDAAYICASGRCLPPHHTRSGLCEALSPGKIW